MSTMDINSIPIKMKSFVIECKRVLQLTKKPSRVEYKTIVKASALGILIIGLVGFVIHMINILLIKR